MSVELLPIAALSVDEAVGLEKDIFGLHAWPADEVVGFLALQTVDGYAAKVDGAVAGYILWQQVADEAEIITIGVREAFRRHGVGGALLDKTFEMLEKLGVTQVFLHVRLSNLAAQRLYESRHFKQIGLRKRYYGPAYQGDKTEDAIIYRWERLTT